MDSEDNTKEKSNLSLAESYNIDFTTKLPQFDTRGGVAFAAVSKVDITLSVYALVHNFDLPMRDRATDRLLRKTIKFYNNLIDQGVYSLTDEGSNARKFISIIERPLGPSLDSAEGRARINLKFLQGSFLKSVLISLAELHGNKIIHRAITPANIFFSNADGDGIVLGECFSSPAGSMQPSSFATIDRAACVPIGRGEGGAEDDAFALGACLMTLAIEEPIKKTNDPSLEFKSRLDKGSYRFLESGKKTPDALELIIRGLMSDDAQHRWGLEQVAQFIDGHQPRLSTGSDKFGLSKPVTFDGKNYSDRRALAQAMSENIPLTVSYLTEVKLATWVSANLTAEILSENAEALIMGSSKSYNESSSAELVARICAYLDPTGPLRYNGLTIAYDGIGPVLASAYSEETGTLLDMLKDVFTSKTLSNIVKIVGDRNELLGEWVGPVVWASGFVKVEKLGKGVERTLYELNPKLPCLSDKFEGYWVRGSSGALKKLDQILGSTGSGADIFDNHVSAFCSAKTSGLDSMFGTLPNGDLPTGMNALKFIDTIGAIQSKVSTGKLPNLCKKLCEGLRPVVKEIHYKPRREMLAKRLDELSTSGNLSNVSVQLKLSQHKAADEQEFAQACSAYKHLEKLHKQNKIVIKNTDPRAVFQGYSGISFVGMIVLAASVVITVLGS
jgi:hypothetical protein